MPYLFWKVLACWPPIHVKMGDPAYGGHANGKRSLNSIIQYIGRLNGRTLVRNWNTLHQWRSGASPKGSKGAVLGEFLSKNCFATSNHCVRSLLYFYGLLPKIAKYTGQERKWRWHFSEEVATMITLPTLWLNAFDVVACCYINAGESQKPSSFMRRHLLWKKVLFD